MSGALKNILVILVGATVLFFGYRYFFAEVPVEDLETSQPGTRTSAQAGKDFLVALVNLQQINLDTGMAVLNDPSFARLEDMSVSLPTEQRGRPNPFNPIGVDVGAIETTSTTTNEQ